MPTLLFTGPGGAGTTTLAAAAAVRAARAGRSTLLVCAQRPPLTGEVPGLQVVQVAAGAALERFWAGHVEALRSAVPQLTLPPASSVVPLPGAGGLALLAALARTDAEVKVVDAGALPAAAELLALPDSLRFWLDQLLPPRLRALGAVRTAAVASGTVRPGPVDAVLAVVPALQELLGSVRLTDPAETAVHVVAEPRDGAAEAVRGFATGLAVHGQRIAGVVSRGLPADALAADWWAARRAEQEAAVAALAAVAPVTDVPLGPGAPADADALAALFTDDLPGADAGGAPQPERVDAGWRLTLPLPFAERGDVSLTRCADDLVVTAGPARRSVRLDALLRRCTVTGGRLADPGTAEARLEVTFAPDPQLWPADLLAAEGKAS